MATRGRKGEAGLPRIAIERRIGEIGNRQLQLVRLAQLEHAGLSRRSAAYRCEAGRLHRLRPGVYAIHPPPYSREQHLLAAVLACGPAALASRLSAAEQADLLAATAHSHQVVVPGGRGRTAQGIEVHRSHVDPRDRRNFGGVPTTSPDRVLIDLAPTESEQTLEMIMVAADSKGLLKRGRLDELVAERRGRPGIPKLEHLLALEPEIARSEPELLFLPVWQLAGVPRPRRNHPVSVPDHPRALEVDLAWPEIRLCVELDSQRFHGDWESAERDRDRDQMLALAGWVCHRFVRRRVVEDRSGSAERLRRLYEIRLGSLRGRGDQAA
jgi:hypothetical protein